MEQVHLLEVIPVGIIPPGGQALPRLVSSVPKAYCLWPHACPILTPQVPSEQKRFQSQLPSWGLRLPKPHLTQDCPLTKHTWF